MYTCTCVHTCTCTCTHSDCVMYTCTYTQCTCILYIHNVHTQCTCDTSFCAEAFKSFPALEQLELLVCGITDISISNKDFTKLQVSLCIYTNVCHVYFISVYTCTCTCAKCIYNDYRTCKSSVLGFIPQLCE